MQKKLFQFKYLFLKNKVKVSPMTQLSKVIKSRDAWKDKAVRRAEILRDSRKTKRRHQRMIADLKTKNKALEDALEASKKQK